jgi:hypothetical protein
MPRFAAVTMPATVTSVTNSALRTSGNMVRARVLALRVLLRAPLGVSASLIAVSTRIHSSQAMNQVVRIAISACAMPRAATFSSITLASDTPHSRDASSKKPSQMNSVTSVPTNCSNRLR